MSGNAQPPARLIGRGGGVLGEPAALTRYAHPNAHDSEEARGEAAAQSATEVGGPQIYRGSQQIAENDDAAHRQGRTGASLQLRP
jgi:hypothetical protein